jgi:uncharacterized protein (DUF427 family)
VTSSNPAPGFRKHPDYRIEIAPAGVRVQVSFSGELLGDSRDALVMKEGSYPPVYYLPRKDVRMDRLKRSTYVTHCPFKGEAVHFSIVGGPENAAWSYEQPFDEMNLIRHYLAFYPGRIDLSVGSESKPPV